jgi:hypothetical protein
LYSSNWSNGEKKREGSYTPQKLNKTKQFNRVGNEENGYQAPDHNKTMINLTNEPSEAHKKKNPSKKNHRRDY